MPTLTIEDINSFIEEHISEFHQSRLEGIKDLSLNRILKRKNPYLYKVSAKESAHSYITAILDATISSSEETIFGLWLETLARYINEKVYGGVKAGSKGQDLVFVKGNVRYIVSIKSGPYWSNASSKARLMTDFRETASSFNTVSKGEERKINEFVVGCCYGKHEKSEQTYKNVDFHFYCGQKFWCFISGMPNLYTDIIEPLGINALEKNEEYLREYNIVENRLEQEFLNRFCNNGQIDWEKLVRFNSETRTLTDIMGYTPEGEV